MKKKLSFIHKVRIFLKWIKEQEDFGLVGVCDLCQSSKLIRLEDSHEVKQIDENTIEYSATYECKNCGGVAEAKERWKKPSTKK